MVGIRPARPGDIDCLIKLLTMLFSIEEGFLVDKKRQRRGLEMMLASEQSQVLVAVDKGVVVGMCSGQRTISTAEGGFSLLVEDVIVAPEYRRQGIGQKLMAKIAAWAEARSIYRLQLLADKKNGPALTFYQGIGWQQTQLVCLRQMRGNNY